jgi:hypothetical protein
MSRRLSLAIVTTLLAIAGCSGANAEEVSDGPTGTSTEALVAAVPKKAWLELVVADFDPSGIQAPTTPATATPAPECVASGKARLADLSQTVSTRANGMLAGVLQIVDGFTKLPPTAHDATSASWGPVTGTEPKGTFRFEAHKNADGTVGFALTGQKAGESEWRALFSGATKVVDADHRVGNVQLDLAQLHAMDPDREKATSGAVAIKFGNLDGTIAIEMTFGNASGPETPPTNAKYKFARKPDGAGAFEFVAHSIDPVAPDKVLLVNTAWSAGGAGKSRAAELIEGAPLPSQVVECWTPDAGLVFHQDSSGANLSGSVACCPNAPEGP